MKLKDPRTNWKYILIILSLSVFVGGGIFWWAKTQEIPFTEFPEIKKPEKPLQDETADWKTYRNEFDGYSLKHPLNWIPVEVSAPSGVVGKELYEFQTPLGAIHFYISRWEYLGSLNEFLVEEMTRRKQAIEREEGYCAEVILAEERIQIRGKDAGKILCIGVVPETNIYVKNNPFIYYLYFSTFRAEEIQGRILNLMLSTFRFLE